MGQKATDSNDSDVLNFEEALGRLEGVVRELEEGDLGLNEALAQYEQGVKWLRQCYDLLAKAERRIELVSGVDAEGKPVTTPMDDSALSLEQKAQQRSRRRSASRRSAPSAGGESESEGDVDVPGGLF